MPDTQRELDEYGHIPSCCGGCDVCEVECPGDHSDTEEYDNEDAAELGGEA